MTAAAIQRRQPASFGAASTVDRGRGAASSDIPSNLEELCANSPIAPRTAILATVASNVSTIPRGAGRNGPITGRPVLAALGELARSTYLIVDRLGTIRKPNAVAVPKHTQGYVLT